MKLWVLRRIDVADYDETHACVARSGTEESARALAEEQCFAVKRPCFRDPARVSCEELTQDGEPEIIVEDILES